ncbi:multidrug efflux SMR transporter [Parabacteroides sp. OttesenSCG-928-N08]|nr:multidrug efflux SMR transporter [Parabacteroides sp. OttesenSCG-928-N08]
MGWIYLILGGLFEIGWPLGMKLAQTTGMKLLYLTIAALSMALSGYFLYLAQRTIPIGTAYIVWTGVGSIGTLIIGILFFGDSVSIFRMLSASLIIAGIIGLKLAS